METRTANLEPSKPQQHYNVHWHDAMHKPHYILEQTIYFTTIHLIKYKTGLREEKYQMENRGGERGEKKMEKEVQRKKEVEEEEEETEADNKWGHKKVECTP